MDLGDGTAAADGAEMTADPNFWNAEGDLVHRQQQRQRPGLHA